jgi:flagellar biosynthetic protein FliR
MFSVGLGIASLGLMAAWIWAVPLIAQGMHRGIAQLGSWLVWL